MAGRATIAGAVAASLPVAIGLWLALRHGLPPIAAQPMLFALQCSGAVVLLALVPGIEAVAHERLFHRSIDPLAGADSPRLVVNQRYIQNTLEQLAVLLPGLFLLARYEPDLRLIAATAIVWTLGRWAWWVGYHIHPLWRGLGVYSMFLGMVVLLWGVGRFGFDLAGWAGVAALLGPFALIELWLFRVLRRQDMAMQNLLQWRPMTAGDLDGVVAVARVAFPDHPEGRACFVERLALAPDTCFVLAGEGRVAGYLIAYPWPLEAIPPLDTLLGALPSNRDSWYLHDLALLPEARGGGNARAGLDLLFAGIDAPIALVSVNESAAFWQAQGFAPMGSPALQAKLSSYGPHARYMVRSVPKPVQTGAMHFDLLQSISLAGDVSVPNDDRAGFARAHAWVIDGATDLGPPGLVGAQGGAAWLASVAQAAFTGSGAATIGTLYADVAAHILAAWERDRTRDPEDRWEYPLASALAVRLGAEGLEIGWLGDCVGFLRSGGGVVRLGPEREIRNSEAERAASLAEHGLGSPKRSAPILANLRATRGRPGMRVLSVDPEHMAQVDTAGIACAPGDEVFLMSDGYAALIDSYAAYDDTALVEAIRARGLAAIAEELRAIERADAACARFPRFKASDDATALWLRIGG